MKYPLVNQSLCQIWGISDEMEIRYRQNGYCSPGMLIKDAHITSKYRNSDKLQDSIQRFKKACDLELTDVIINMFRVGHRVRVVHDLFSTACFMDIETDSTSINSAITCITTSIDGNVRTFIRGKNLLDFLDVWNDTSVIVTFNGKRFDLPIIVKEFDLSTIPAQVDLMEEGRPYGLHGGLKNIEKHIGYVRKDSEINGITAVSLWREYTCDKKLAALDELVSYNIEDVESLIYLYRHILMLSTEGRGFHI